MVNVVSAALIWACLGQISALGTTSVVTNSTGYDLWWSSNLTEVIEPLELEIIGEVPQWVNGDLLRNGPGAYEWGEQSMQHQFDGLNKVAKFDIVDGRVHFQTRFVKSSLWNDTVEADALPPHLTMLPVIPAYSKIQVAKALEMNDLDNTNIFPWQTGNETFLTCDTTTLAVSIDLDSLDTIGHSMIDNEELGKKNQFVGAHKLREVGGTATIGWMGETEGRTNIIKVYKDEQRLNGKLHRTYIGKADAAYMTSIHSFAVTKDYIIIMMWPLTISPMKIVTSDDFAGIKGMEWLGDDTPTTIFIFDAHSEDEDAAPLRTFTTTAMYANHHINAWEKENGAVEFDLIGYNDASFISDLEGFGNLNVMKNETAREALEALNQTLRRITVNMSAPDGADNAVAWRVIPVLDDRDGVEHKLEMPRFNDLRHGARYCYFYAMGQRDGEPATNMRLSKVDLCGRDALKGEATATSWWRMAHYPSEPIFVPRPDATAEDDGVLLTSVLDGERQQTYLLVLNATDMTTLATAYAPVISPYDVHGQFFGH